MKTIQLHMMNVKLTSIKKYAFEKNDERIYLCADHIEKELHKLRYGGAKLDTDW